MGNIRSLSVAPSAHADSGLYFPGHTACMYKKSQQTTLLRAALHLSAAAALASAAGGAAAEARRGVLANDDFRRCMHLLAEPGPAEAYAAERRDGLRQRTY